MNVSTLEWTEILVNFFAETPFYPMEYSDFKPSIIDVWNSLFPWTDRHFLRIVLLKCSNCCLHSLKTAKDLVVWRSSWLGKIHFQIHRGPPYGNGLVINWQRYLQLYFWQTNAKPNKMRNIYLFPIWISDYLPLKTYFHLLSYKYLQNSSSNSILWRPVCRTWVKSKSSKVCTCKVAIVISRSF